MTLFKHKWAGWQLKGVIFIWIFLKLHYCLECPLWSDPGDRQQFCTKTLMEKWMLSPGNRKDVCSLPETQCSVWWSEAGLISRGCFSAPKGGCFLRFNITKRQPASCRMEQPGCCVMNRLENHSPLNHVVSSAFLLVANQNKPFFLPWRKWWTSRCHFSLPRVTQLPIRASQQPSQSRLLSRNWPFSNQNCIKGSLTASQWLQAQDRSQKGPGTIPPGLLGGSHTILEASRV